MAKSLIGIFIILHGLVHLWYVVLNQRLVAFRPEMGWNSHSWLFTGLIGDAATRWLSSICFLLATIGFVVGGVGLLVEQSWWRQLVIGSAALSGAILILFWDGSADLMVEKGLIGLLINIALLVALLVLQWSPLGA